MKRFLSIRCMFFCIIIGTLAFVLIVTELFLSWGSIWFLPSAILFLLLIIVVLAAVYYLLKPYQEHVKRTAIFASTLTIGEMPLGHVYLNPQSAIAAERLNERLKASSSVEMSRRQAQYQALQNQINPHFLYNTLESIRSEALLAGLASVAQMCEALAKFFRYTIGNMKDLVSLQEEIDNIKTYFYIQQYRFGSRLKLVIKYEKTDQDVLFKCTLPKLTLQPIVENAIIHGIEQKIGEGTVTIQLILTEKRLLIYVSDDGAGMDEKALSVINEGIRDRVVKEKDGNGIAIANVSNRIKLLFGEGYGIVLYSTVGVGTDVEISLPRTTKRKKELVQELAGGRE